MLLLLGLIAAGGVVALACGEPNETSTPNCPTDSPAECFTPPGTAATTVTNSGGAGGESGAGGEGGEGGEGGSGGAAGQAGGGGSGG